MEDAHGKKPIAVGKSSYDLVDADKVFSTLNLQTDTVFLDLACGRGAYSLDAAKRLGKEGLVYGVDLWEEGVNVLKKQAEDLGLKNIKPLHNDASKIHIQDNSIDICLMATVLHDFVVDGNVDNVLKEVARVLKPKGILAIIEFKKIDGTPGPPIHIRMSPDEVEKRLQPFGFTRKTDDIIDVGPYNYLIQFAAKG